MSRSYRHHFIFSSEGDKEMKKFHNRRVRRKRDLPSYGGYKKVGDSWEIKCFSFMFVDEEDYVRQNLGYGDDEETLRKKFRKYYLSK
jgi:hypothetical protein